MYRRILVPLDGSKLAECALPHAEALAKGCDTEEVILVSVTERVSGRTRAPEAQEIFDASDRSEFHGYASESEIMVTFGKMQRQAQRYLCKVAKGQEAKEIKVKTEVLLGNPAEEIVNYAKDPGCDIIVMSSHGRSGPSRWAYGSVADKVFRGSPVPVLMIRAPGCVPDIKSSQ
jgi:nucleotide-binding universal stress UspA family protein